MAPQQENVLQVAGSYSGGWTGVGIPVAAPSMANYQFLVGDVLNVRQRKFGANVHGGILIFGNGIGSYFDDQDGQRADDDTLGDGTWHNRRISLDGLAGTLYTGISVGGGTSTDYNFQFASISVTSADGSVRAIYNGDTNGPFVPVPTDSNGTKFYLADHLGSAQMEFSASGAPLSMSQFMPFGTEINPPVTANHYKFTGKERDSESGLDYFGARYYGSNMGRFMSPDAPVDQHPSDPQSWNLYSYVRNNPLSNTDPTGNYDCGANTSSAQCFQIGYTLALAQNTLDQAKSDGTISSSQYKQGVAALGAYGTMGDGNGVTVNVGATGGYPGTTYVSNDGTKTAANPTGQDIQVTLNGKLFADGVSDALTTATAHEGSHVLDAEKWAGAGFTDAARPTNLQTEFNA